MNSTGGKEPGSPLGEEDMTGPLLLSSVTQGLNLGPPHIYEARAPPMSYTQTIYMFYFEKVF